MFSKLTEKQRVAVIALVVVGLTFAIIGLIALLMSNVNKQTPADTVAEQRANTNIDAGITELLARGVTTYQIDSIKNGLYQFAQKNNQDIEKMTMDIDSIKRTVGNVGEKHEDFVTFTVKIDAKKYNVRANLPGLSSAQVIVSENETEVFDSGLIDLEAQGINE